MSDSAIASEVLRLARELVDTIVALDQDAPTLAKAAAIAGAVGATLDAIERVAIDAEDAEP